MRRALLVDLEIAAYLFFDYQDRLRGQSVVIEIGDEAYHNKQLISSGKFYDDLLKLK